MCKSIAYQLRHLSRSSAEEQAMYMFPAGRVICKQCSSPSTDG